jgi:hypothetical protein
MQKPSRPALLLALLLVVSAALFAICVTVERSQPHREVAAHVEGATAPESAEHRAAEGGAAEGSDGSVTVGAKPTAESPAAPAGEGATAETALEAGEKIFGINPEATALVIAALIGSLLLAMAAVRFQRSRVILGIVAVAALAFAAFDVREVLFRVDNSRSGIAVIAAIIAAIHVGAAGVAGWVARTTQPATA